MLTVPCADRKTGSRTGSDCKQVGEHSFDEVHLFTKRLSFEEAQRYRKSYGRYLRKNQWDNIDVEVVMLL